MTDEPRAFIELPFSAEAREQAQSYGHPPGLYAGIEPAGDDGEYVLEQVEAIEAARRPPQRPPDSELEVLDSGTWNGRPNYGCPKCPLKSLDKDRVREHLWRVHQLGQKA